MTNDTPDRPVPNMPVAGRSRKMSGNTPEGPRRGRKTKPEKLEDATRMMTKKVKTSRERKKSSKLWLER